MSRKSILWVGDAGCDSGFAKSTHNICDAIFKSHDVHVLGINFHGDQTVSSKYPYPLYTTFPGGDLFGTGRLIYMCDVAKPDLIVIQQDGWNLPPYMQQLAHFKEYAGVPVVAVVAVDGQNFQKRWLDGINHAVFWTQFGLDEARAGGYAGPASVIPLGVDRNIYRPMNRREARKELGIGKIGDAFVVGAVNRNQPRKRWDLLLKCFSEWVHGGRPLALRQEENTLKIKDAYLVLHVAPTGDVGVDFEQLARYYKIFKRLHARMPRVFQGVSEEEMAVAYNCFDIAVSTSQGEGFGLTAIEAMACGVPCVLPEHSALADWAKQAAWFVPCSTSHIGPPYVNVIGGVIDETKFVEALHYLYTFPEYRKQNGEAALERASESRFEWPIIGQRFVDEVVNPILESAEKTTLTEVK